MGLVSSNKSWANFSNRSDSNYTRDNCCIFDVYTTSSQQIQYSEFGRAFKCHPISLPTTLLTRQHLQSTGDPNVLFVLSIPVPIDLPTDRLFRGGRLNRPRDPKFSAHRSKRSVFLFLFFLRARHKLETRRAFVSSSVNEEIISLSFFVAFTRWMENRGIDEEREERSPIRPGTRPAIRNRSLEEIIVSGPPERESRYPTFPGI